MAFVKLFLLCVLYTGVKCDNFNYKLSSYFYKDIGCVKNDKYANAYDCPEFPSKNGSCRYENHYIQTGEKIPQELLKGTCIPQCKCNDDGFFNCAGTDCILISKEGCHQRHSLDSCCPSLDLVCGDDIATCEIEGKTYKEGEKFYLKESCDVCVCDKGFKKEAPFCKPVKCSLEALRAQELADHAAAVYLKGDTCCPSTWIIDENEDDIYTIISDVDDIACKFGKKEIKLGTGFDRNISRFGIETKLSCECHTPPFVICREV